MRPAAGAAFGCFTTARLSFYLYNTKHDIDVAEKALKKFWQFLKLKINMDIYSETILDHYQHPRQAGELADNTVSSRTQSALR